MASSERSRLGPVAEVCSFSSTWRTWVLTVDSLMKSRSPISRLRSPSASSAEHLPLALAEAGERIHGSLGRAPARSLQQPDAIDAAMRGSPRPASSTASTSSAGAMSFIR